MARKATLEGVESINYDGHTLEVTFEEVAEPQSLEGPEAIAQFSVGELVRHDHTGADIQITGISDEVAGEHEIDDKGMTVYEYPNNHCTYDDVVYLGKFRGEGKEYAFPEIHLRT